MLDGLQLKLKKEGKSPRNRIKKLKEKAQKQKTSMQRKQIQREVSLARSKLNY